MSVNSFLAVALTATLAAPQQPPPDEPVVVVGIPREITAAAEPPKPEPSPTPAAKRPKPKVELRCSPAISNALYVNGGMSSLVSCTVRVSNPDEQLWCPEVAWSFGNARSQSSHESDCKPFDVVVSEAGEPPDVWSEGPKLFGLPPGRYEIWAKLLKSGKLVGRDYFVVYVN